MLTIAELREADIANVAKAFAVLNKTEQQYRRYFAEHQARSRFVLVARSDAAIAGYVTIMWQSDYPPFREAGIPEIQTSTFCPIFAAMALARS